MVNSKGSWYSDLASEEINLFQYNLKQLKTTLHFINLTGIFAFYYYNYPYYYYFFLAPVPILSLHDYD